ncbi:MAG: class I SAM-dependent methyltransferase [Tissierellia bacterium]|nr:class I SAM-dependent methyltransferase [Tissierellia bacterium]
MIAKERYSEIIDEILTGNFQGKIAIDATVGRGNDTIKLLKTVGEQGFVYGFDIQAEGIEETLATLNKKYPHYQNYKLFIESHVAIDKIDHADLILYNLGYLPRSDKKIVTRKESTILSIKKALRILNPGGVIVVVQYLGHPHSKEERIGLEAYLKSLDQKRYIVEKRSFFNQINNPPNVYVLEKKI